DSRHFEGPPQHDKFRGSIPRPQHSLSTLRPAGCPARTQDSLPAAGSALPGGIGHPQGSFERFPLMRLTSASSFPKLGLAQISSRLVGLRNPPPATRLDEMKGAQWSVSRSEEH